ncbi:hypothetical protein T02_4643 [Trichinella nativa]|uniref:Uncharacterized protein n=1 Tax=Trichinella nativa TaxID=6335 RepID=A0A0V1KVU0_9BILA|nr:hypothetical protein T02_4643 [Trichinella nativa]
MLRHRSHRSDDQWSPDTTPSHPRILLISRFTVFILLSIFLKRQGNVGKITAYDASEKMANSNMKHKDQD